MTKPKVTPVKLVRDAEGRLCKPTVGEMIDGFECNGVLFESEDAAKRHLEHLPLRDRLQAAMFEVVVNTDWFDSDDDDVIEEMAERLALSMLGMKERIDGTRDEIISILQKDKELYSESV